MNRPGDWKRSDGSRLGERTIQPGGRVRWRGRWFRLHDGPTALEEYKHIAFKDRSVAPRPRYDGRMDGLRGLFYAYSDDYAWAKDSIHLHHIIGEEWPGPHCVAGVFVWDTFVAVLTKQEVTR